LPNEEKGKLGASDMYYYKTLHYITSLYTTPCLKKTIRIVSIRTSSNFHQFDNFWHKDGQDNRIV